MTDRETYSLISITFIKCIDNMEKLKKIYRNEYLENTKRIMHELSKGLDMNSNEGKSKEIAEDLKKLYTWCEFELESALSEGYMEEIKINGIITIFKNLLEIHKKIFEKTNTKNDVFEYDWKIIEK